MGGPFKGASVYLNLANSKRKLFGLYEHGLNDWISSISMEKDFIFDVGANTGYDTYGLAHLLSRANTQKAHVVAFEPEAKNFPELTTPKLWDCYSNSNIEIIEKFAGAGDHDTTISIDQAYEDRPHLENLPGLMKIDVEGAEIAVMQGAQKLLSKENISWLIEIHGKDLIPKISQHFADANRPFLIKDLTPLPIIGKEQREIGFDRRININ